MLDKILINVTPREVRIACLEKTILREIYFERQATQGLVGNIYRGKVKRLMPGIQAAFIDIGLARTAFLHWQDIQQKQNPVTDIRELLRPGQELLVQVYKDPQGAKGPRVTTFYTLAGRYLVLTPHIFEINASQRLTDETERQRLLQMITPNAAGGYIFRTAATGVAMDAIVAEQALLAARWAEIMQRAKTAKVGQLIEREISLIFRTLRDVASESIEKIYVDDAIMLQEMRDFAKQHVPFLLERIEHYTDAQPIFVFYAVENELQKALQRKVYLRCGGHLVFDQTEAMTTIDVNTGSYLGQGNAAQTILQVNLEAAETIARQIRLRNLGGMIIIDFVDLVEAAHKTQLLQHLKQWLAKDSVRTEVSEVTSLGLVQLTRKRTRASLLQVLCVTCPTCQQRGVIKSTATVSYEIFRLLKHKLQTSEWKGCLILAAPKVIDYLLTEEEGLLQNLRGQWSKPVQLRSEVAFLPEYYEILPL